MNHPTKTLRLAIAPRVFTRITASRHSGELVYLDCAGPAGSRSVGIKPQQLLASYRATQAAIYSRVGVLLRLERFDRDPAGWQTFAYELLGAGK